ncbi:MAG: hypothetical protein RLZZ206_3979 [Cyanobacteriota bacterium]
MDDIPVGKRHSPQQKNLLIPLKELGSGSAVKVTAVKVVNLRVWQFYHGFRKGADNPDRYLGFMRAKQPSLVDAWLKTPRDKRIFIVGSGKESELADSKSRDLQKQGYRTFFFNDCKPIACNDAHVGAMLATADNAYFLNTPLAQQSRFVEVEIAAARRFLGYEAKEPIVIPAEDLLKEIKKQSMSRMDDRIVCEISYSRKLCPVE